MWTPESHKLKMKASVDKFISHLKQKGIEFSPSDGDLNNVIFTSPEKVVKISHHSFYRYSGIACIYKEGKHEFSIETIDVTDEMFMNTFMKPIIETHFGLRKNDVKKSTEVAV